MTQEQINWYKYPPDNTFADVNGYVIESLQEKCPAKTIFDLIVFTSEVYANKWNSILYYFFFNSKITKKNYIKDGSGIKKRIDRGL